MASSKKRTRRSGTSGSRATRSGSATPKRSTPASTPEAEAVTTPTATPATRAAAPIATSPAAATGESETDVPVRQRDNVDWGNEYSYVIGDLKQLAVVSAGLFAIMIAIGFFL